jgi:acyl-CoA synthetase
VRQLLGIQAPGDRPMLVGAPVAHAIGMLAGLLGPPYRSQPVHLIDVWEPARVLDAMVEADLTAGAGATFFCQSLLDAPGFGPEHVERMGHVGLGGSAVPAAFADRAEGLGIGIARSYGSTEHPSTTGSQWEMPREKRNHTDGRPLAGVEVRIVDASGRDLTVGEAGEIWSRGPDLFTGYTNPALTEEAVDADGWYATGDIGVLDADGFLTITDRKKDIIIRGGENVSAAEVEGVMARLPGVAEVAAVAAPDARLGEHVCAFVRGAPGGDVPDLNAVRTHLEAAGLARQKWPEELRVVDELPRTPSGKVKKYMLRELLREEHQ